MYVIMCSCGSCLIRVLRELASTLAPAIVGDLEVRPVRGGDGELLEPVREDHFLIDRGEARDHLVHRSLGLDLLEARHDGVGEAVAPVAAEREPEGEEPELHFPRYERAFSPELAGQNSCIRKEYVSSK